MILSPSVGNASWEFGAAVGENDLPNHFRTVAKGNMKQSQRDMRACRNTPAQRGFEWFLHAVQLTVKQAGFPIRPVVTRMPPYTEQANN